MRGLLIRILLWGLTKLKWESADPQPAKPPTSEELQLVTKRAREFVVEVERGNLSYYSVDWKEKEVLKKLHSEFPRIPSYNLEDITEEVLWG